VRCLVVLLALVVLGFSVDRLGLRTWIAWLNRRAKPQDNGSKQYWRLHWWKRHMRPKKPPPQLQPNAYFRR